MNLPRRLCLLLSAWVSVGIVPADAFRGKTSFRRRVLSSQSSLGAKKHPVTFKNLEEMISSYEHELVLLAFTSDSYCGPCKIQRQEWESLASRDGSLKMLRIDMNQFPKLGTKFNIGKLPCTIMVKGKEVVLRADGLVTAQELWDRLQLLLPHEHPTGDD